MIDQSLQTQTKLPLLNVLDLNPAGCSLQLAAVVETKCQNKAEYDKYKLYVDEMEKVMYLLLKLSGRLARAQNAVLSLPDDASEKHRVRAADNMVLSIYRMGAHVCLDSVSNQEMNAPCSCFQVRVTHHDAFLSFREFFFSFLFFWRKKNGRS